MGGPMTGLDPSSSREGRVLGSAAPPTVLHVAKEPASLPPETEAPCPLARLRIPEADGVTRPRLLRRLDRILQARIGLVVAPAGFGKTTVLAQWARQSPTDVAWYRVDAADSDVRSLVRGLAAAIAAGTGVPLPATDLPSLIRAVEVRESPLVLVIDDVQLGGPETERLVYELLLAAPPHLHVLIGSRRLPNYNLARSELRGFLVRGEQLRFHHEEVETLFRDVYGAPLAPEDAALLTQRTGGWAAALHIFHLSMTDAGAAARRRLIRSPVAARYTRDYLCGEVLDGLPAELGEFVRRTCVFEVVTAARCDQLLDRRDSQRLLEDLQRWQALTNSPDGGQSFRYHSVMREHLETELMEELGETELARWRERAARVLERQGSLDEALRLHATNNDWSSVQRLVHEHGREVADRSRTGWLRDVPASVLHEEPQLALAQVMTAVDDGRLPDALQLAQRLADRHPPVAADDARDVAERIRPWTGTSGGRPDDTRDWSHLLREGLQHNPLDVASRAATVDDAWASLVEGIALLLAGNSEAAAKRFQEIVADAEEPRLSVAARLAAATVSSDAELAHSVADEAAVEELPWLARLARSVAEAEGQPAPASSSTRSTAPSRSQSQDWGAVLALAIRCASQVRVGHADPALLERLAALLRRLGAPVLEAWARAGLAYTAADHGLPDAEREAASAEAFAQAAGVPGALALAHAARGMCRTDERQDLIAAAEECADAVGMTFRPWSGELSGGAKAQVGDVEVDEPTAMALRCFGRFEIRIDGSAPDLKRVRPRARALLRLLAVHAGRPVHRELIMDALWRDLDVDAATHNLHVSISSLRRALEPGTARGASRLLLRDGERYVLRLPPGATCDLRSFDQALGAADVARGAGRIADAVASLTEALDLYNGEVLPEDGPEEWVLGPREHYRSRAAEAAAAVAELHLSRHDPGAAAAAALRSIDIDPCRDASWRLLVSSYQAAGDLAAAERARRSYADVLASLGVVTETASSVLTPPAG